MQNQNQNKSKSKSNDDDDGKGPSKLMELILQFDTYVRPSISKRNPFNKEAIREGWKNWMGLLLRDGLIELDDFTHCVGKYCVDDAEKDLMLLQQSQKRAQNQKDRDRRAFGRN